jgi:hypothetical protein
VRVPRSQTRARVPDAPQRAICLRRQTRDVTSYAEGRIVAGLDEDRTCPTCGESVVLIVLDPGGQVLAYDPPRSPPLWLFTPHPWTCGTAPEVNPA